MEPNSEYTSWVAELREKQDAARDLANRIDEGHSTQEDRTKFRELVPGIKALSKKIDDFRTSQTMSEFKTYESATQRSRSENPSGPVSRFVNLGAEKTETETINQETLARYSSLRREMGEKKFAAITDPIYTKAVEDALRYGRSDIDRAYLKALDSGADERGAVTAPAEILTTILTRLNAPTRVAGLVREINTSRDSVQFWRNAYDADDEYTNTFRRVTTGSRPASDSEALVTNAGAVTIEPVKIQVHTYMMVGQIENDLLMDSSFDLMSWFTNEISKSAAQDRDNDIINGTGVGQNMGIANYRGRPGKPALGSARAILRKRHFADEADGGRQGDCQSSRFGRSACLRQPRRGQRREHGRPERTTARRLPGHLFGQNGQRGGRHVPDPVSRPVCLCQPDSLEHLDQDS